MIMFIQIPNLIIFNQIIYREWMKIIWEKINRGSPLLGSSFMHLSLFHIDTSKLRLIYQFNINSYHFIKFNMNIFAYLDWISIICYLPIVAQPSFSY